MRDQEAGSSPKANEAIEAATGGVHVAGMAAQSHLGAVPLGGRSWHFRVWAPNAAAVAVELAGEGRQVKLSPGSGGYFLGVVDGLDEGMRYSYLVDDRELPDPSSRWQPDGVHGPSALFDPGGYHFRHPGFVPGPLPSWSIYELHVGTFTAAGTLDAAADSLGALVDLGVSAVEPMPIAQFPGRRNWGYDAVFPFAVQNSYGGPRAFQRFVDRAHELGLAVVLDVVYNHLGPEGNVLSAFGPYFTDRYRTPWGDAINVDGAGSDDVRRYLIDNAAMWFRDFQVDGLRLDAIHGIIDPTARPFIAELSESVESLAGRLGRPLVVIGESADNNPQVIRGRDRGGFGLDAQWSDDFHHSVHALLTGERQSYYRDFGHPDQLARAIGEGFAFQGEYSHFRGRRHGAAPTGVPLSQFVISAQNHDQVGNRPGAERLSTLVDQSRLRLVAALLLLSPEIPLLFMGEEYGEAAPFPYFIDHTDPELVEAVRRGRAEEFATAADELDPAAETTFLAARLDRRRRDSPEGAALFGLYQRLLALRAGHPVIYDPAVLHSEVTHGDGVLRITRVGQPEVAVSLFNLTPSPRRAGLGLGGSSFRLAIDAGDPTTAATGPAPALRGDGEVEITGFGFCCYLSSDE
jgi:maltooligosyltrehalose trehalohydrolase